MSAIYYAILTNAGQAKLANALALGVPLKITHMAVGDGNGQPVTPNAAKTELVRERRRAPINTLFQDPLNQSQIVAEQIIPENVGDWWIRELGIFSEDGTLVAVANCPDTYKPLLTSGAGRTQVIRMVLIVSDTSAVELKIDPAVVLATRKYVDDVMKAHREGRDHPSATTAEKGMTRFATLAEALAGGLDDVALTPKNALEVAFSACPVGAPIPWPLATPPTGFLMMTGQAFNKTAYPKLGAAYPSGVLPDLRGEFIRGWDNGRGVDSGRALLSSQTSQNIAHTHSDRAAKGGDPIGGTLAPSSMYAKTYFTTATDLFLIPESGWDVGGNGLIATQSGGTEARPRNIAYNYIVRAA